ncbi:pilus assembly PilX family protein [Geobacter pickeringii]|uniref:Pilus assembly protein PilX n=1 Tax=Geobacter pickeringii TaxID=345632 RepID=A0A0B5B8D7_9BACT|nr:PilX N-terminal domain-containing pilus assembly protein [Geobacter pickeringii]AJE02822.1 pilus assembly protein PilX [Geobacter pickeringii]
MKSPARNERGVALVMALIFLMVLSILVAILHRTTLFEMFLSRSYQESQKSFYAAEAGVRAALGELGNGPPENMANPPPYFYLTPTTPDAATWSIATSDSSSGECSYRYYIEHLKDGPPSYAGGESAKLGFSAAAGAKVHYYRITAEGINKDGTVTRQVQVVTTAAY